MTGPPPPPISWPGTTHAASSSYPFSALCVYSLYNIRRAPRVETPHKHQTNINRPEANITLVVVVVVVASNNTSFTLLRFCNNTYTATQLRSRLLFNNKCIYKTNRTINKMVIIWWYASNRKSNA